MNQTCLKCGATVPTGIKACEKCNTPISKKEIVTEKKPTLWSLMTTRQNLFKLRGENNSFTDPNYDITFRLTGFFTKVVIFIIIILTSVLLYRGYVVAGLGSNGDKNIPIIYIQDDSTLKFTNQLRETPVTVTNSLNWDSNQPIEDMVKTSADQKGLIYLTNVVDGVGDLYYTKTTYNYFGLNTANPAGELIAKNVIADSFDFVASHLWIVYKTVDGDLFLYQNSENIKLSENMLDIVGITTYNTIYYTTPSSILGDNTLYKINLNETDKTPIVIASNVRKIFSFYNNGDILYGTSNHNNQNPWDVWNYKNGVIHQIATGVHSILDVNSNGDMFFSRQYLTAFDPFIYFLDSYELDDAKLEEPLQDDFTMEVDGRWGIVTTEPDIDSYQAALSQYNEKVRRDEIREMLGTQREEQRLFSVYFADKDGETLLDSNIGKIVTTDSDQQVCIYLKEENLSNQLIELDKIKDAQSALEMLESIRENYVEEYYYNGLEVDPYHFSTAQPDQYVTDILLHTTGMYYRKSTLDGTLNDLIFLPISNTSFGYSIHIDTNVFALFETGFDNNVLYTKLTEDGTYSLMTSDANEVTTLLTDVSPQSQPHYVDNLLFCYTNYSEDNPQWDLTMRGNKSVISLENIYSFQYRTKDYIYVLGDLEMVGDHKYLNLYKYSNQHSYLIDTNVTQILPFN